MSRKEQASSTTEPREASPCSDPNHHRTLMRGANAVPKPCLHRRVKSLPSRPSEINGKALFWFLRAKRPSITIATHCQTKNISPLSQSCASSFDDKCVPADLNIPELSPVLSADTTCDDDGDWTAYSTDDDDDGEYGYDGCGDPSSTSDCDPLIGLDFLVEETA